MVIPNVSSFFQLFEECQVLLCWIHMRRTLKEKVLSSAEREMEDGTLVETTKECKAEILEMILKLRDSNTGKEYDEKKEELDLRTRDIFVCPRPNKHKVTFTAYFNKNWHRMERREMWVKLFRKNTNLCGTNTTNAVESIFRKIKHFEKVLFGNKVPSISELLPELKKSLN